MLPGLQPYADSYAMHNVYATRQAVNLKQEEMSHVMRDN
jgi:hypothetical protein